MAFKILIKISGMIYNFILNDNISWNLKFITKKDLFLQPLLILYSHLCLDLFRSILPVGLPVKSFERSPIFIFSYYMPCPSHFSRFNHSDYIR